MYYAGTIEALRTAIERKFPGTKPGFQELGPDDVVLPGYLLWMCEEVATMDTSSLDEALKAARWMGWVFAHAESMHIWTNARTRDFVRADRRACLDRPHPT